MRRTTYALAVCTVGAAALGACTSGSSGGGSPSGGGGASALAASGSPQAGCQTVPRRGGSLVYARQVETQTLNPIAIRNGNGDIFADELIYDGLVSYDPKGTSKIQGGVAQSWVVSPDGRTYTFRLRPGVKFSNGSPVTAEDVKFSLDRFGNPNVNQVLGVLAQGYRSSRIVNSSTVAITLTKPVPAFLDDISVFPAFIVPKTLVESQGAAFFQRPVGTGPYMVKDFVTGSHITFVRNPYYWEPGKPYLDSVRYDFATDSNSRLLALTSGAAQVADGVPFSQIQQVQSNHQLVLQGVKVPAWIGLSLNHKVKPLADLKVRQAIQYALDRQTINKAIFHGAGTVPNSMLPQFRYDAAADVVKPYTYDLTKAKQLMAQSGFPRGFTVTLSYPAGFDYYNQLTILMKQDLGAIGIKVNLIQQDAATIAAKFGNSDYQMTFPYPQLSSDIAEPDEFAGFYTSPGGFYTGWSDPAISKLVTAFTSSTSDAQRSAQWPAIQRAFMDQTPVINVMDIPLLNAHAKNVCGTDVNGLGADQLQDTWLASGS